MKLGIVGLPNVGKNTLFNAITNAGAGSANYPFCIIGPNVGAVAVPNHRLDALTEVYHPKKTTPAVVEFMDIAGLAKGASKGQGLGNKFLVNIQECGAIVHVVRCFDDENIMHMVASTSTNIPMNPTGDIGVIDIKLIIADVGMMKRRINKARKTTKGDKRYLREMGVFSALEGWLNDGNSARSFDYDESDAAIIAATELLSLRPVTYIASLDEEGFADCHASAYYKVVEELAAKEGTRVIPVCARLEAEITELDNEEKKIFLDDLGIAESGLGRLIKASYALLDLVSSLTSSENECCAWTIRRGTKAPQATGKIHADFERGFIRAEMIDFSDLVACGSMNAAKEKGLVRSEDKEYVMKDGGVVLFRFNV